MSARKSLLVVLALLLASPAVAQDVTISVSPGGYSRVEGRDGDRMVWGYECQTLPGGSSWADFRSQENKGQTQTFSVPAGADTTVTLCLGEGAYGSQSPRVGSFSVLTDGNGAFQEFVVHTPGAFDINGSTLTLKTWNVTFNAKSPDFPWYMDSQIIERPRTYATPVSYQLPATFDGTVYNVRTPGSSANGATYKNGQFTVDTSGNVTVTQAGAGGLKLVDGKLTFTNNIEFNLSWSSDDKDLYDAATGTFTYFDNRGFEWHFASNNNLHGFADRSVTLIPGVYKFDYFHRGPYEPYLVNASYDSFEIPLNAGPGWSVVVPVTLTINEAGETFFGKSGTVTFNMTLTAIPEPATMSLLALGGLAMLRRRKR